MALDTLFRFHLERVAKSLFKRLGCEVHPTVFLVGYRREEKPGSDRCGVIADENPFPAEALSDLPWRIDVLLKQPSSSHWIHPSREIAEMYDERWFRRVVGTSVEQVVTAATGGDRRLTFCSAAVPTGDHLTTAVLQLSRPGVESWPELRRGSWKGCSISRSLIEAAVDGFLSYCADELGRHEVDGFVDSERVAGNLVREAGKRFGYTPAAAGGHSGGMYTFYDACNVISSLRYEGGAGAGRLVVCDPTHPGIRPDLMFATPVRLTDYTAARKLLELSSGESVLFTDSDSLFALGRLAPDFDPFAEDLFEVRFVGRHVWELWHERTPLMRVAHNEPRLPIPKLSQGAFVSSAERLIPGIDPSDARHIGQLAATVAGLGGGSLLVVSADAAAEAGRLERQAVRVRPTRMTPDLARLSAGIDGAALLDPAGTCHAIGVILDGVASRKADPARGSRYNSAVRYVYGRTGTLAVVISEDGMVDVLPALRPRIRRADLDERLDRLRDLVSGDRVERKELSRLEDWLRSHQFYLNADQCGEVNRLLSEGKDKFGDDGPQVVNGDLNPDEDMNDSYFLDD